MNAKTPRRHTAKATPSPFPATYSGEPTLTDRAIRWICPWEQRAYPGLRRVFLSIPRRPYTWRAVRFWRAGRVPMPAAVADAVADLIEARSRAGLQLVADLREHATAQRGRLKVLRGCCAVRDDGRDRRGWR